MLAQITKITNRWNPSALATRFARRRNRPHAVARSFFSFSIARTDAELTEPNPPDSLFRTSRAALAVRLAARKNAPAYAPTALISMPTPSTSTTSFFAPGSVSSSSSSAAPRFLLRRRAPRRSRASCASITSEVWLSVMIITDWNSCMT